MESNEVNPPKPQNTQQPEPTNIPFYQKTGGDWSKANESYFNAVKEIDRTHESFKQVQERAAQLEAMLAAGLGMGNPVNQNPFQEFDSLGINSKAIEDAISQRVNRGIEEKLNTMLGPVVSQVAAEEQLANEIPDFDQHKSAARKFMKENPDVKGVFDEVLKTNPVAAWKYAIKETVIATKAQPQRNVPTHLGQGRAGERQEPMLDPEEQAQAEAKGLKYFHEYGDATHYTAARYKGTSIERAVRDAMRDAGLDY